jgi:glycosyltransferase involved in cell wall biosynthesis
MADQILVKVCMITYNHEDSIADAIDSVLMQQAEFRIQLVIGEDCSTDQTRSVCEWYAERYPKEIVLLPSERNLGIQANGLRTLEACCDARFVAFIEGDDKWIARDKLADQIAILDVNPEFSAVAQNAIYRDLRNNIDRPFGENADRICTLRELVLSWPFHAVSLVARSAILKLVPSELPSFISVDRFLNMWLGSHGTVYYEGSKAKAVYHRHSSGASQHIKQLEVRRDELSLLTFLRPYFKDDELYREAYSRSLKYLLFLEAQSPGGISEKSKRLSSYLRTVRFHTPSDLYYLFLIVGGKAFYNFHQYIKKKWDY